MAVVTQGGMFDSKEYGLTGSWFTATLTHNVQATLPAGITPSFRKPYTVAIADDYSQGTQRPIGFAWDLDSNYQPRVTVQLESGAGTIQVRIWVGYQV